MVAAVGFPAGAVVAVHGKVCLSVIAARPADPPFQGVSFQDVLEAGGVGDDIHPAAEECRRDGAVMVDDARANRRHPGLPVDGGADFNATGT